MRGKKLISVLLVLVLAAGMISSAAAASVPTVSISSGAVKAGESVTLTVSIKDNPGLAAWILYIYYDTSVFELDSSGKSVRAAGNFREDGSLMENTIAEAKANGRYFGDAGKDGILAYWYNGSGSNTDGDGEMLTIKLKAKAAAVNGTYQIGLGYSERDTRNTSGDKVSFKTVGGTVTVTGGSSGGVGTQPEDKPVPTFTDVGGHWAYDYIEDAAQMGLMEGYQNLFRPDDSMTRCEFVTVLWRAMGEPRAKKAATFTDLTQDWYRDAVAWAQENNIIQGTGGNKFEPLWPVSREQVALILHRLAGEPRGMEMMLTDTYDKLFKDSGQIHSWAKPGVYWSVYQEIYCGIASPSVGTYLMPTGDATRAQIAVMMVRYLNTQGGT